MAKLYELYVFSSLDLEESAGPLRFTGEFLRLESESRNKKRVYRLEEAEAIALGLKGKPVFYGTRPEDNKHDISERTKVGKVLRAWVDKVSKTIKGTVEIVGSRWIPGLIDLLTKIKRVGFSIKARAKDLINGRLYGVEPLSLQVLLPHVEKGFPSAMGSLEESLYSFELEESASGDDELKTRISEFKNVLKNMGLSEIQVLDVCSNINSLSDLQHKVRDYNVMASLINKGPKSDLSYNPPNRGGGIVRIPGSEQKDDKWRFKDVREGIDELYSRVASGDQDAVKKLNKLWDLAIKTLKRDYGKMEFAITQCPSCGGGILEGERCPYCNWDPEIYRAGGGEVF